MPLVDLVTLQVLDVAVAVVHHAVQGGVALLVVGEPSNYRSERHQLVEGTCHARPDQRRPFAQPLLGRVGCLRQTPVCRVSVAISMTGVVLLLLQ